MPVITDMQAGKAGEYLVCADLIIQGYIAFPSEQGLPYDVVAQIPGRLIKIQVKSMRAATPRANEPPLYSVTASQRGKGGRSKYKAEDADIFAFVALDEKSIAYMPFAMCKTCMEFRCESHRGLYMSDRFEKATIRAKTLRDEGMGLDEIARQFGVSRAQAHRYLKAFGQVRPRGKYLADFPFGDAVAGLNV